MTGQQLTCLYALGCPPIKKIGPQTEAMIEAFAKDRNGNFSEGEIESLLKSLKPYGAYQKLAAFWRTKSPLALLVAQSYWLGNEATIKHFPHLPFHNYTVLMQWTGARLIEELISLVNLCLIRSGKVQKANAHGRLLLESWSAQSENDGTTLALKDELILIDRGFLPESIKKGQVATTHFGTGRQLISQEAADLIRLLTQKTLDVFNTKAKGE